MVVLRGVVLSRVNCETSTPMAEQSTSSHLLTAREVVVRVSGRPLLFQKKSVREKCSKLNTTGSGDKILIGKNIWSFQ